MRAIAPGAVINGGLNLEMWGTIVNRDGVVCVVARTGLDRGGLALYNGEGVLVGALGVSGPFSVS